MKKKAKPEKSHPDRYFNNHEFENYRIIHKEGENADNLGPNGLVVSAGK